MKAGAFHYVTKPFRTDQMILHVSRALQQRQLRKELQRLHSETLERNSFEKIIGKSEKMQEVFSIVRQTSDLAAILRVIESPYGNKAEAARILGVDRTTLYRKLEEY